jgi:DNA-binding MarR family transcriptional regulator
MRMTHLSVALIAAIMKEPEIEHCPSDLAQQIGVRSNVLFAPLKRAVSCGYLTIEKKRISGHGRIRTCYSLTEQGREFFTNYLVRARADSRFENLTL